MLNLKEVKFSSFHIPSSEIKFHPNSFGDLDGRLFWWNEELYRGISAAWMPFLSRLIQDGVIQRMVPAHGLSDHCYIAATERFQCDMVIALSLIEYLVVRRSLNFEQVVDGLVQFSKRWVVAEFVLHPDRAMYGGWIERMPWYTLDNFANVLSKHFRDISVISFSSEGILFLCEK